MLRENLAKFKRNKLAFFSFIVLTTMFVISLPAELLFNDKPLIMSVDGKLYYPIFSDISLKTLGGEETIPIINFKSKKLMDFLNGVEKKKVNINSLFDLDDEDEDEDKTSKVSKKAAKKHDYWFVWAPYKHSYKSSTITDNGEKISLLSPEQGEKYGHLLGTDKQGKDVLARLIYGFRISMFFGLGIAFCSTIIGVIIGGFQGFFAGLVDLLGQRLTEIWGSLPSLYLLIIMSSFLSKAELSNFIHYLILFLILNLTAWMGMAAYMRAEFLKGRGLDYVKAAKALGVSDASIMVHHILPNSLTPIITFLPFAITGGILSIVSLDFLSLGVRYPAPSIGELLSQGKENLHALWLIIPTFIVLTITLTLLTFIGDGVRNAFDPRKK